MKSKMENISKFAVAFILLLKVVIPSVQGKLNPASTNGNWNPKIVGGIEAPLGSVPHQVSLQHNEYHYCGGSKVARDFVVTAAHCCSEDSSEMSIYAGLNDIKSPEGEAQKRAVGQVIIHPNYTDDHLTNDICILRLSEPLILSNETRTAKINLPALNYSASGNANVTGWGATSEDGPGSEKLLIVEVPIVTDEVCRDDYGSNEAMADSMICAGTCGKDSCRQGDSGGPLVDANGFLIGIVSWGKGCARDGYPGVYTEVAYFAAWVKNTLSQFAAVV